MKQKPKAKILIDPKNDKISKFAQTIWVVYCQPTSRNAYFSSQKLAKNFITKDAKLNKFELDEYHLHQFSMNSEIWE